MPSSISEVLGGDSCEVAPTRRDLGFFGDVSMVLGNHRTLNARLIRQNLRQFLSLLSIVLALVPLKNALATPAIEETFSLQAEVAPTDFLSLAPDPFQLSPISPGLEEQLDWIGFCKAFGIKDTGVCANFIRNIRLALSCSSPQQCFARMLRGLIKNTYDSFLGRLFGVPSLLKRLDRLVGCGTDLGDNDLEQCIRERLGLIHCEDLLPFLIEELRHLDIPGDLGGPIKEYLEQQSCEEIYEILRWLLR